MSTIVRRCAVSAGISGLLLAGLPSTQARAAVPPDYVVSILATGLNSVRYPAVDAAGNVYVTVYGGDASISVKKVTPTKVVSTVVNSGGLKGNSIAGPAASSPLQGASQVHLVTDAADDLYLGDSLQGRIHQVDPSGALSFYAGSGAPYGTTGPTVVGPAASTGIYTESMAWGPDGALYVATGYTRESRVIRILDGQVTVAAGAPGAPTSVSPGLAPGVLATEARFGAGLEVALDAAGNLFILDPAAGCIVKKSVTTQRLTTVAGNCGTLGSVVPGPAKDTPLGRISSLAIDSAGHLYFFGMEVNGATVAQRRIYRVVDPASASPQLVPIMGPGLSGNVTPGLASASRMHIVSGIAVGKDDSIYATDRYANALIKLSPAVVAQAPTAVAVTSDATQTSVTFTPPVQLGNVPILTYQYSLDGGLNWLPTSGTWAATASGGTLTGAVPGLTPGQGYDLQVRAMHEMGPGAASATVPFTAWIEPVVPPVVPPVVTPGVTPGTPAWYRDPVPAASRAKEVAIPMDADAYRGRLMVTKANYRAGDNRVVMPVSSLKGRPLGLKQGAVLTAEGLFDRYSSRLTVGGKAQLRLLAPSLKLAGSIRCEGYTDYYGGAAANRALGLARAKTVCAELRRLGVQATQQPVGYGEARPVLIGGLPTQRKANRRVVVQVTGLQ